MTNIPWYEDDFEAEKIVPDVTKPPERTAIFQGWLRHASDPPKDAKDKVLWRLYSPPYCLEYIEFDDEDVVAWRKQTPGGKTPNLTIVWLREGAQIRYVREQQLDVQAGFLQGPLVGGGGTVPGAPGAMVGPAQASTLWPGCGGGGVSLLNCGGVSVLNCGGVSLLNCGGTSILNCGGLGGFGSGVSIIIC